MEPIWWGSLSVCTTKWLRLRVWVAVRAPPSLNAPLRLRSLSLDGRLITLHAITHGMIQHSQGIWAIQMGESQWCEREECAAPARRGRAVTHSTGRQVDAPAAQLLSQLVVLPILRRLLSRLGDLVELDRLELAARRGLGREREGRALVVDGCGHCARRASVRLAEGRKNATRRVGSLLMCLNGCETRKEAPARCSYPALAVRSLALRARPSVISHRPPQDCARLKPAPDQRKARPRTRLASTVPLLSEA